MDDQYIITIENRITRIRCLVNPTIEMMVQILDELAERDIYERRLWDLSKVDFNWTIEQLQSIADYGKSVFTKPNRLALYTKTDLAFGEMRQFSVFREEEDHATPRVFRSEDEAIKWLNS